MNIKDFVKGKIYIKTVIYAKNKEVVKTKYRFVGIDKNFHSSGRYFKFIDIKTGLASWYPKEEIHLYNFKKLS